MQDSTSTKPIDIASIIELLETWAPSGSALSYDNVGLQVGRKEQPVDRALIALDLTPEVIAEASERDASLIITHHPLLFKPLSSLTDDSFTAAMALKLAEAGIALYSIHTNLDAAPGGVSFALAKRLGLVDIGFLDQMDESLLKLATFVPRDQADAVREALAEAGAGRIGDYDACAFTSEGTGYFRAGENTDPFIGEAGGDIESADEVKLEVEVAKWNVGKVLGALRLSHPYEEVAYDLYPVKQPYTQAGLGAIGTLEDPLPLDEFLQRVAERLSAESLRYSGSPEGPVERVAVCGGAGSDFRRKALAAGADAYVTSDVKYHDYFDVFQPDGSSSMAFIDAGHYETEALTEELLKDWLEKRLPEVDWLRTQHHTGPMKTFIPE